MLRALLPVVAGILTAMHFALPLWLLVGGFLLCGAAALLLRSPLHAAAMLFLFGAGAVEVHGPVRQLPAGRSLLCTVSIGEFPTVRAAPARLRPGSMRGATRRGDGTRPMRW